MQRGKLLLNLNNAVNALNGLPLRAQLPDRDLRCCTAALIGEALAVLRRACIRPARLSPLPPVWLPGVLRLPTPRFRLIATRMLRIDGHARSSMADDLLLGRPTEIGAINDEVLRLAASVHIPATCNARIGDAGTGLSEHHQPVEGRALRRAINVKRHAIGSARRAAPAVTRRRRFPAGGRRRQTGPASAPAPAAPRATGPSACAAG